MRANLHHSTLEGFLETINGVELGNVENGRGSPSSLIRVYNHLGVSFLNGL